MDSYGVSKEVEWDMGHRVPNHKSKCRNPHGHRYKLRVHVRGPIVTDMGASDEGMVADFGDIKKVMTELVHDKLDHGFMVYENDEVMRECFTWYGDRPSPIDDWNIIIVPFVPTAENMAKWCYEQLAKPIADLNGGLILQSCFLWETPTSIAVYPS